MKLWLLRPIHPDERDGPWWGIYDCAFGFVVRAEDEAKARALTDAEAGDEWPRWRRSNDKPNPWRNLAMASCVELTGDGPAEVILRDFNAG